MGIAATKREKKKKKKKEMIERKPDKRNEWLNL